MIQGASRRHALHFGHIQAIHSAGLTTQRLAERDGIVGGGGARLNLPWPRLDIAVVMKVDWGGRSTAAPLPSFALQLLSIGTVTPPVAGRNSSRDLGECLARGPTSATPQAAAQAPDRHAILSTASTGGLLDAPAGAAGDSLVREHLIVARVSMLAASSLLTVAWCRTPPVPSTWDLISS